MATLAQISVSDLKKEKKPPKENVEWLWQYSPPPPEGRENQLVLDPRFRPFLAQYLTAPQTFWGSQKAGYKSLAETALDFLSVPDKVLADDNRYVTITGCVYRFCPPAASSGSTSAARIRSSPSLPSTGSKTTRPPTSPTPNTLCGSSPITPRPRAHPRSSDP